jgi:tetratricopeptide (TPR) repeat protein
VSASFLRLRTVVEAALDRPVGEREAWVRTELADEAALREEALDILRATQDAAFLQPAAARPLPAPAPAGTRIGQYQIVRVLGSGGMGTVYEARQDTPARTVAVKMLTTMAPEATRRFHYEVEVLGLLQHPNIAAVYEAGLASVDREGSGRPWFALEFVPDARTILAYAEAAGLDPRARIELFLQVLDAVEYGHRQGVIHRDLKPDNLLVNGAGQVKVIDFGVARVQDPDAFQASMRTRADEIVGTLAYMSPEQVAGHAVDTRSDVYSLGVVLYQLLTDRLPIEVQGTGFLEGVRRIAEDAPARATLRSAYLDRDLEAVLMTALAKEPDRRYRTVADLAQDLQRHLAGEPVTARAPGAIHAMRLFARRHRALVGATALVFAVTVVAAVVSFGYALESQEAEQRAQAESRRYRELFESQFAASVETIAEQAPEIARLYGGQRAALRMTQAGLERLQQLEDSAGDDPELTLFLADAYARLAAGLMDPGARDPDFQASATLAAERALELAQAVSATQPTRPEAAAMLASTYVQRARVRLAQGDMEGALQDVATGRSALPDADNRRAAFARCQLDHVAARVASVQNDLPAALKLATRRIEGTQALLAELPDSTLLQDELADGLLLRANVHRRMRDFVAAEGDLRACLAGLRTLGEAYPERLTHRIDLGYAQSWLAIVYMAQGRRQEAHGVFQRAYELSEELMRLAPTHVGVRGLWAEALRGQGRIASDTGVHDHPRGSAERRAKLEEALDWFRKSVAVYDAIDEEGQLDADRRRDRDHAARTMQAFERMLGVGKER